MGVGSARPPIKPLMTEKILRQSREAESALADALVSFNTLTHTSFESYAYLCGLLPTP